MVLSNLSLSVSYTHRSYLLKQMAEEGSDLEQGIFPSTLPRSSTKELKGQMCPPLLWGLFGEHAQ